VFRDDVVYDARLVHALLERERTLLISRDGSRSESVAAVVATSQLESAGRWLSGQPIPTDELDREGVCVAGPDDLVPPYTAQLRKSQPAFALPMRAEQADRIEKLLFDASYKGVTDFVTRYVWPAPALAVVRACARTGITPNAVTAASWILVLAALACFSSAAFGLGLAAAWLMTFLDTVDGKLARVTLQTSRVGHVLDHGLDLIHPPFWYLAWGLGLGATAAPGDSLVSLATWLCVGGYLVGRLLEGVFMLAFGLEIHSWRRVDSLFRLVTARRNPNLVLLTAGAVLARPDLGLAAVAAWTVASIGFHTLRLGLAGFERLRGGALQGWQEAPVQSGGAA